MPSSQPFLKGLKKNAQGDPGEKKWACYYCGKEGDLKRNCPQASKPHPAPCPICKRPYWKRDCSQRYRFQGSDSQNNQDWRCLGVATQAPILITPEEPWVLITVGGQSVDFLLDTGTTYSVLTEAPGPLSSWSASIMDCLDKPKDGPDNLYEPTSADSKNPESAVWPSCPGPTPMLHFIIGLTAGSVERSPLHQWKASHGGHLCFKEKTFSKSVNTFNNNYMWCLFLNGCHLTTLK